MNEYLWVEKYRPRKIDDVVLPESLKADFKTMVKNKQIPNLLLAGSPGIGKTTIAKALLEELGCDYIVINGSMNGGIDSLRNEILNFASSVSLSGGKKYVILDEADYLTQATMAALRNFLEEYSSNCGFIFTCNLKNRIIDALKSRLASIDFTLTKEDKLHVARGYMKRVMEILDTEGIAYEKQVIAKLIEADFPDFRKILNQLQRGSVSGSINSSVLSFVSNDNFKALIDNMKSKNFRSVRHWIAEHSDIDPSVLYRMFYDHAYEHFTPETVPLVIVTIGKYQYQQAFVADQEINTASAMVEIMADCDFK